MKNALKDTKTVGVGQPILNEQDRSFFKTVGATLAYKYDPLIDKVYSSLAFPSAAEEGYRARDHIPDDLMEYGTHFLQATNKDHMDFLVKEFRENKSRREYLNETSFFSQVAAEFFDPINYIALPFVAGTKLPLAAVKAAGITGTVVAGQEALRAPFDPLATKEEVALNITSAAALGGLIGTAISVPTVRRNQAIKRGAEEIDELRKAIEPIDGVEIDPKIADSWFTDSPLFNAVSTPMKRVLQDKTIPAQTKLTLLEIANDSGILLNAHKSGVALKSSVFQNAKLYEGEWVKAYDDLLVNWGDSTGKGVTNPMDYLVGRKDFETWLEVVDRKTMKGERAANDFEAKAMDTLNAFYSKWEKRLRDEGLIGSAQFYKRDITKRKRVIKGIEEEIKGKVTRPEYARLKETIARNKSIIEEYETILAELKDQPVSPPFEEVFRPRYWDKDAIKADREGLAKILSSWFKYNTEGYKVDAKGNLKKFEFDSTDEAIKVRVDDAIDNILGLGDELDPDVATFGSGMSKHLRHRTLDIPNKLVLDYMHTNTVSVMKAYTARTAPRYQFSAQFGGKSIDDVLDDEYLRLLKAGKSVDEINAILKDMRHLYDRVAGTPLREPDTLNQGFAEVLRTLAQLNYLGSAGIATLTEPARIIMEHGLGKTMKGLFTFMKDNQLRMGAKELRIAGEALEILHGSAHLRLVDDLNNNPLRQNIMDKSKNVFYLLNGLAPITRIFKDFDGMMRSHTIIDYSVRWTKGQASKQEQEWLLRYGIDLKEAKKITASPHQQGESGLYIANTEKWGNVETVRKFRVAMSSGASNTILMGTPADKPIITDGVAYLPIKVARKLNPNAKEDPKYRGYVRAETPLLALPFQFYSYAFAALNKTTAAYAHGQLKNKFFGTAIAMGLGYMVLQAKTPDFVEMSFQDQFARSFDYSGIAALHSDMVYTAMATTLALGGSNLTGGLLQPRFPQEKSYLDAVTGLAGAGPSIAADYGQGMHNLLTGNVGEGTKEIVKSLPFARVYWWKGFVNDMANAIEGTIDDRARGFGRF
jgi:hypothetical protein